MTEYKTYRQPINKNVFRIAIIALVITLIVGIFATTMLFQVGVGQAGMVVDPLTGSISDPLLGPAFGVKAPWASIVKVHYARETLGMFGDGSDPLADQPSIGCFSKDQLEMQVSILIRWSVDPNKLRELYQSYPSLNWEEKAVASIVKEHLRYITKQYTAVETIELRDQIGLEIEQELTRAIREAVSLRDAIINIEVDLRDIGLPDKYTSAIEDKLAAEQLKIQAEFEAERKIVLANADAQALLIGANATAQQKVIDGRGIREAIDVLIAEQSITDEDYMEFLDLYVYLKTLETLAENENVTFIVGVEGENLLIQPQKP
ncbi:MAG: prohibitin family protein [Candidatus Bathyarchaeota archaeon]|nr:prohibitin family protein [Candidatus Bathyarchaeota archaeon]MDI9577251.1 prohibitin family protein [Thermoproteota archaeon]MDT8782122.1 prohibitin family protein [Candidatus Bathyarchaeota archaeon]NLD66465.1 prohibitin family protein [Thermoproteota archaeon]